MEFEKKVPVWNAEGTEPPEDLKESGFTAGFKPPAAFFNWFWTGVSHCLAEIRTKLSGHADNKENPHGVTVEQVGAAKNDLSNVDPETFKQLVADAGAGGFSSGTDDLTAGESPLAEGEVYFVYE